METQTVSNLLDYTKTKDDFEQFLLVNLTPIFPRPEFVHELQEKLVRTKLDGTRKVLRYGAIGVAGVFSSLVIIATGVQAVITLLGTIKLLRQLRLDFQK